MAPYRAAIKNEDAQKKRISHQGQNPGVKFDVYDYRVWFWGECCLEDSFADTVSEKDRFLLFPCRSLLGSPLYVVLAECNVANNTSVEATQAASPEYYSLYPTNVQSNKQVSLEE